MLDEVGWRTIADTDFDVTQVEELHREFGDSVAIFTVTRDPTTRKVSWIAHDGAGNQRVVALARSQLPGG